MARSGIGNHIYGFVQTCWAGSFHNRHHLGGVEIITRDKHNVWLKDFDKILKGVPVSNRKCRQVRSFAPKARPPLVDDFLTLLPTLIPRQGVVFLDKMTSVP